MTGNDKSQYVVFQIQPNGNPIIMLDGENLEVVGGTAIKRKKFGTYEYRVDMDGYHSEIGKITVNDPQNKHVISITMRPAFGAIEIPETKELAGASVFLDNKLEGIVPLTIRKVASGQHSIRVVKPLYSPFEQTVTVKDGETTTVKASLSSNSANVTLNVDGNAEIWVNGERKGFGSWTGTLEHGTYQIETRKTSHQTQSEVYTISEDQKIKLHAPIPIYGSLNISVIPDGADILIDEKKVGDTPMFLQEVLVGRRNITIRKTGYTDLTKVVDLAEDQTVEVDGAMIESSTGVSNININTTSNKIDNNLTFTVNGVSFTMIAVEGGTFEMGSEDGNIEEGPVHSVTLSSFYIGETEVTQELWKTVMGTNPSKFAPKKNVGSMQRPVEQVSKVDCQKFIGKLNQLTGQQFRLPTEAEWEYAARGGNMSRGYRFAGSNDINAVAWYFGNAVYGMKKSSPDYGTHVVKAKQPNELGIYDMSGNVWEWCQDWYEKYSTNAQTNPTGPLSGVCRIVRGGCWTNYATECHTSKRHVSEGTYITSIFGLRLALSE